jgi:pyruvate formate lyase activating enzyme
MSSLADQIDRLTTASDLCIRNEDGSLRCLACAHRCLIKPGRRGICQVRFNRDGELRVPRGYVAAAQLDPIEKKPFSHFLPGSRALTFGMLGCDLHCDFCQNCLTSQALRDPSLGAGIDLIQRVSAQELVDFTVRGGARVMASSYNEPLITSEWAVEIFQLSKKAGLKCVYISNGYGTREALDYLKPWLDGYKIDLKSMQAKNYRDMGAVLDHVLETIQYAHEIGLWVEVVTLVIPGMNDSNEELWEAARFIAGVSRDIPWHVTAFHPDYRMNDRPRTSSEILQRAAEIGQEAGLRYVYAGNLPGRVGSLEDTFCPNCSRILIRRQGFTVLENHINAAGACPSCAASIAGVWY